MNQLYQVVSLSVVDARALYKLRDNQAGDVPFSRSIHQKQSVPACTFYDHEIREECSEIGSRNSNLLMIKRPCCFAFLVGDAICNLGKVHVWL